ncbi:RNA polymerase, sigma 54 subunit, RpoN/SigL [Solimonas aquatica]|uniref:RNA polymerase sigma-54 factor n=1 Tax=Solimonas aquatica TaxID=489703 RepID=A0A1H9HJ32_9GAMM|nr:RNA polymerase factor sigma-54 [Solimonas aquatica]SEQ62369.1 RNA polymerase, sigma 54 subunit, RpoN/SigL [Solimonas aquatica]
MSKVQIQGRLGQQMAMTPQLLQSIRLLQLSSLELEQELRQALQSNVMLEGDLDLVDEEQPEQTESEPQTPDEETEVSGQDADARAKVEADFDWSSAESWSGGEPPEEDGESWEARLPAQAVADARVAALAQLQLMVRSPREAALVAAIVEAVDDNGYLEESLDDIAARCALQPAPQAEEMDAALRLVQSVEPSGFAARDLRECLRLQLAQQPRGAARTLAGEIIDEHLELLAAHDYAALGAALQVDAVELHGALDLLLSLNPKPGSGLAAAAEAALPDLIVTGTPGAWKVELNAERLPRLRVNRLYERTIANSSHRALRDQLQEARWLVRGLEMRHDTLLRTGRAIFERQQAFLERGEEGMAPLTLREIAERIGMHESTVCRVTTNKWVQTPWGVYELKAFFPSQIAGREGDTSGTAVKAMIRRIINAENRQAPLSDGQIGALLARQGVRIARRTVAKYREGMRIPAVKDRLPSASTARLPIAG